MLDNTKQALLLAERRSRAELDEDCVATLALVQILQIVGEAAAACVRPRACASAGCT
jgi:hypothetical protein